MRELESALRELKRVLRGGGKLAITTWGPRFFEPANTAFWNSVRNLEDLEVVAENGSQTVNSPSDWWAMIMGSGYRGTVEQLTPEAREQVQKENTDFIQRAGVRSVECNVVYGTAIKPF